MSTKRHPEPLGAKVDGDYFSIPIPEGGFHLYMVTAEDVFAVQPIVAFTKTPWELDDDERIVITLSRGGNTLDIERE